MLIHPRLSVVYTSDRGRTLDFLTSVFDFEMEVDVPRGDGGRWVEVRLPGAQTSVAVALIGADVLDRMREQTGRMSQGWFQCEDLDTTCARVRARGAGIVVAPQETPWRPGGRWAQVRGWDGNLYGLVEGGR
ncbi:VOC family protein [Nocardiopsis sp. CNT312]|uniref:VOC family protein n=1 Tax=Nocardiopsis sp. CNT312 TaxID=1137268 RepID=UPI000492005D|nr:VOC family protein [Nocardiopsis sp. CNT312]